MNKTTSALPATNLEGQLLIAMPGMSDERFARSVVCMCAHSDEGAMGLIMNKPINDLTLGTLLEQVEFDDQSVQHDGSNAQQRVHNGGPVETNRGFVVHSPDYVIADASVTIASGICLTATTDILTAIARGEGPSDCIVALGYAGWAPGQLESELAANGWLNCVAGPELVFGGAPQTMYDRALATIGVDPSHLVSTAGTA